VLRTRQVWKVAKALLFNRLLWYNISCLCRYAQVAEVGNEQELYLHMRTKDVPAARLYNSFGKADRVTFSLLVQSQESAGHEDVN